MIIQKSFYGVSLTLEIDLDSLLKKLPSDEDRARLAQLCQDCIELFSENAALYIGSAADNVELFIVALMRFSDVFTQLISSHLEDKDLVTSGTDSGEIFSNFFSKRRKDQDPDKSNSTAFDDFIESLNLDLS